MQTKRCSKCDTNKPVNQFWKNSRTPDKLQLWCKTCYDTSRKKLVENTEGYHTKQYQHIPKEKRNLYGKRASIARKHKVLEAYGTVCKTCGFSDVRALSIDHIAGDGAEHRRTIDSKHLYQWLINNNFPDGFQTLCMNCQWIKRHENQEFTKSRTEYVPRG